MDTTTKKGQHTLYNFNPPEQEILEPELEKIIFNLTGTRYDFASSASMRWGADAKVKHVSNPDFMGPFYQLMPDSMDDGFFDWYCERRPEQQFFEKKEDCALQFIHYWLLFRDEQVKKPADKQEPKEHLEFRKTPYTTRTGETLLHCPACDYDYVHLKQATPTESDAGRPGVSLEFYCENGHRFDVNLHNHKGYMVSELEITEMSDEQFQKYANE